MFLKLKSQIKFIKQPGEETCNKERGEMILREKFDVFM